MTRRYTETEAQPSQEKTRPVGAVEIYISFLSMVLCVAMMCASAYAYFVDMSSYGSNVISSASFRVMVSANGGDAVEVGLYPGDSFKYVCSETDDGQCVFQFVARGTATQGFCRIVINGDTSNTIITEQILQNGSTVTVSITAEPGSTIVIYPQWGMPTQ